ncbi:unnamed protein product [Withania somnifera]
MADENFQDGVYEESLWINSTKDTFITSSTILDPIIGQYFAWPNEHLDMKMNCRSNNDDYNSSSDDSLVFQELLKNDHKYYLSSTDIYYSTLQILGFNCNSSSTPSSSPDWNHSLNDAMLQENLNSNAVKCTHHELKRNICSITSEDNSTSNYSFNKPKNQDFNYYSDLLQTLFDNTDDPHDQEQPQHQSLFANNINPINCAPTSTKYHRQNSNDFVPSLPKSNIEEIGESTSSSLAKNRTNEPTYKRPRIRTPSPLPTFKVRKEKFGDRITALQQLVSPFGKTDTASVLQEAIVYINFLHDQVNDLSTPYMKNGSTPQSQQEVEELKEGLKQGLRSKGLCLVPISSTFPVAAETTMDFWRPTLGRSMLR